MILQARQHVWTLPRPAWVMGIVNVTPDSFSDGGRYLDPAAAEAHAFELAAQGADLIDIGGESTRPFASLVSEAEELRRVLPVIERLAGRLPIPLSIDTRKAAVARRAIAAGAVMVNDVGAARPDPAMAALVAETGAAYVAMHMQGDPSTMQIRPAYDDVLGAVGAFFADCLEGLARLGVKPDQVVLDPGIGFGKNLGHNLELLAGLSSFKRFDRPLLLGVSRKSFLGQLLGLEVGERLPGALACAGWAVLAGAQIVRTHDVKATVAAVRTTEAILLHQRPCSGIN